MTNWSSRTLHGSGRPWTIMALPRSWERGIGVVPLLVPAERDLHAVRSAEITVLEYRQRFEAGIYGVDATYPVLAPGALRGHVYGTVGPTPVCDGDTLCCACSREAAARGECHRVYAAELLAVCGWHVVLDGRAL